MVAGSEAKQQATDGSKSRINHVFFFFKAFGLLPMKDVDLLGR